MVLSSKYFLLIKVESNMSTVKKLQELLKTKPILKVGGAFDAMSAKLVEINEFDAVMKIETSTVDVSITLENFGNVSQQTEEELLQSILV